MSYGTEQSAAGFCMSPGIAAIYQTPANEWSSGWGMSKRDIAFFYKRYDGVWTFYCHFSTENGAEQDILPVLRGALSSASTLQGDPVNVVNLTATTTPAPAAAPTAPKAPPHSPPTPTSGASTASCAPSIIVLDVRDTSEWNSGHVSCAHHLPVQDDPSLVQQVKDIANNNPRGLAAPIVTYCYSGVRSGRAEQILKDAGFTDVRNGGGFIIPAENAAKLQALCEQKDCGGVSGNQTNLESALDRLSAGTTVAAELWSVVLLAVFSVGVLVGEH